MVTYVTRVVTPGPEETAVPAARSAAGISRSAVDARFSALEKAVGEVIRSERLTWMRRVSELERRLDELEDSK